MKHTSHGTIISGYAGFAETDKGIFNAILQGQIDFESAPWPSISYSAKDLVRKMLTPDPMKRITAAQVLGLLISLLCSFSSIIVY